MNWQDRIASKELQASNELPRNYKLEGAENRKRKNIKHTVVIYWQLIQFQMRQK